MSKQFNTSPLRYLFVIRWLLLMFWLAGLLACEFSGIDINSRAIGSVLAATALGNLVAQLFAKELFSSALGIAADIAWLSAALFFVGGAENPLISMLLLPVAFAVVSLNNRQSWMVGGFATLSYTILLLWNQPWHVMHHNFQLHVWGMWLSFLFSAAVLIVFLAALNKAIQARDAELENLRQQALRDQQVMTFATVAAGAAHELNTPLSTLAMLAEELDDSADTEMIREQITRCQTQVERLQQQAQEQQNHQVRSDHYLQQLLHHWAVTRPDIKMRTNDLANTGLIVNESLDQALRNLLDNAADASLDNHINWIEVSANSRHQPLREGLSIVIQDSGKGIPKNLEPRLGVTPISSKQSSRGMGVILAQTAIEALGGTLQYKSTASGTATIVELPQCT